ncbi:hypothetical protein X946_5067 [Burkholderia sp. ABCPW 111]|nr:hypothetical protein X946_5067 [Burkholderia sp. ABCPW 111]
MFFHFLARIIAALWGSSCVLPTWAHGSIEPRGRNRR